MPKSRIKSTAELAKLDFGKIDEKEFEKQVGKGRIEKLKDYVSRSDILVSKAEVKRAKKKEKLLELKSRMVSNEKE